MALATHMSLLLRRALFNEARISTRYFSDVKEDEDNSNAVIDPSKDRTKTIPVETSIKYMNSKAYQQTYGDLAVWVQYRRNHKGVFAPKKTRKSCVRNGMISTGNPCPICRDEYLVLDSNNTKLLEQFISEHTGQIFEAFKTGLCQKKQKQLMVAIEQAWDKGTLTFDVPFREYDYSRYIKTAKKEAVVENTN